MRALPLLLLLACAKKDPAPAPVAAATVDPLGPLTLDPLPMWTNRYASGPEDLAWFFAIARVTEREGITRMQAVEAQNHFRDLRRADPSGDPQAQYAEAIRRVKAGEVESGLDPAKLAAAKFIAVFDLDETLFDQSYDDKTLAPGCHSVHYATGSGDKWIHLTPGWEGVLDAVRDLGGVIVLFSANVDALTLTNLQHWTWEGTPILDHPDIGGVLTNSHLILQGYDEPGKPKPVVEPSKDLRVVDDTLSKVILVDDNPLRVFQYGHLRLVHKFQADTWCRADVDPAVKALVGGELAVVERELRDSVAWMDQAGVPFSRAFLPYTLLGRIAVDGLVATHGWDRPRAIRWVREHPESVDPAF